jgi:hypothetical protein
MRFAHIADIHIGAWKPPEMQALVKEAFTHVVDACLAENVDFVLLCGDLFDTALPGIDNIKYAVAELKKFESANIPVYIVAGSHDYSPSGKTMLDVLEEAGLVINVVRGNVNDDGKLALEYTVDKKTGIKITGMVGKKGMLEKKYYEALDHDCLTTEKGPKIFLFHTSINELKTKDLELMDGIPATFMPPDFNYYAGGHVHIINSVSLKNYPLIRYPGPVFPVTFGELEKLCAGSFSFVSMDNNGQVSIDEKKVKIKDVLSFDVDVDAMTPESAFKKIKKTISSTDVIDAIVLLRVSGRLSEGRSSDIDFHEIFSLLKGAGAYHVLRNTMKLTSAEFEEIKREIDSIEDIERELIMEHSGQVGLPGTDQATEAVMTEQILHMLNVTRQEGEKVASFDEKIKKEMDTLLKL